MILILFNSFSFLFFGIVVLLGLVIIKSKDYQYLFLLLASYLFYYLSSGSFFVLVIYITLLNYYCAKGIKSSTKNGWRKTYFILSIAGSISMLAFFKYTNFALKTVNTLGTWLGYQANLSLLQLILPIGISFYTFQAVSYVTDVYRKKIEPEPSLLRFALYMTFFPHLLAGPIVRAADFLPQLRPEGIKITAENFKQGVTRIIWGLVKKMVVADTIAQFVTVFFQDPTRFPGSLPVVLGAVAFAIQVYCDFSGYTDIAIGLARTMGIIFPINFDKPFFSKSIAEFWKRWHISLSNWFRDYLFMPLMKRRLNLAWICFSVFAVYALSGLWHGAGWNFVIWGGLHGFFLIFSMLTESWRAKINSLLGLTKIPKIHNALRVFITLYLVVFSLLLFRLYNAKNIFYTAQQFLWLDLSHLNAQWQSVFPAFQIPLLMMLIFIIMHFITYFKSGLLDRLQEKGFFEWTMYLIGMMLILYFFTPSQSVPFVYFQF